MIVRTTNVSRVFIGKQSSAEHIHDRVSSSAINAIVKVTDYRDIIVDLRETSRAVRLDSAVKVQQLTMIKAGTWKRTTWKKYYNFSFVCSTTVYNNFQERDESINGELIVLCNKILLCFIMEL